jgi:hypothetical protein
VPTQTTTEKRKVARIVFDRPPLKTLNFVLWMLAGAALGLLVALLLNWLAGTIGHPADDDPLKIFITEECVRYWFILPLIGLVAGICLGFGWKRQVTARIEMVEQPTMQRRRSTSTAMVRVDYGRRW